MPEFYRMTRNQLRSKEQGADTIVYLAVAEEALKFPTGEFFFDRKPAAKHLWMSGTNYTDEDVDKLAKELESIVEEKGFTLPK